MLNEGTNLFRKFFKKVYVAVENRVCPPKSLLSRVVIIFGNTSASAINFFKESAVFPKNSALRIYGFFHNAYCVISKFISNKTNHCEIFKRRPDVWIIPLFWSNDSAYSRFIIVRNN